MPILPFKLNQDRHRIPRQQRRVTNWPACDASLRERGSLTAWFTDEAIAGWAAEPRMTRGGQPRHRPSGFSTVQHVSARLSAGPRTPQVRPPILPPLAEHGQW